MKKLVTALSAVLFMLLGVVALAEADFTLLVYMCGADLQSSACEDIVEMAEAENGDDMNIVVLAGGAEEWDFEDLSGNTRNLAVIREGAFESIEDWGWASMGSGESLLEFMEYGLTHYPAKRTALVLWDHGAGSEAGVCFDDTTEEQDGLSLTEINDALYALGERLGGFHIDILGCDACMMATYEMAAMLSYYDIDWYVASEELEPGSGWSFTPWLKAVREEPGITTHALCEKIIDSYMEDALLENPDDALTLSAVDLKRIDPLQQAMEGMGAALLEQLSQGNVADVRRGRSRMYTFGSFVDGSWDMVDLGAILDAYAAFDPQSAARARRALEDAVPLRRQTDNLDACCGLSVLIPQDTANEFADYSDGMDLSFYMPNWIGFVQSYAELITGGSYSFSATAPQQTTGGSVLSQLGEALAAGQAQLDWNDETGVYEASSQQIPVEAGEGDYAFTATLTPEDMRYLDYVEGMLMIDITDEDMTGYVDMGLMRNNLIDWEGGAVYSLFDGTWPIFGDQLVPLYDQISNEYGRRSLIPVKLNGEYTYLVVEFPAGSGEGRVIGANAGYDANGLPIRSTDRLRPGDSIVPVYTMYVYADGEDEPEESEFEGDEITWQEGMTVTWQDLGDDGEDTLQMLFCFVLNDVFGGYDMTEAIAFEV